ncbi:M1 family aminopeptidase [Brumimicrobium aurantiacum]|uniref:Aminopeptidase N n=1 Tax=Brumimicrobium aurantiacum TaxID=1737063 RepID=A0A3E1EZ87_9FLAO|nr:M1 family aminopeptidase [Brumimicrobium aurantiacum]RFC54880.1 T9SS C-terminal target domain-containing protein [Brumimicrobium aurantiacum]
MKQIYYLLILIGFNFLSNDFSYAQEEHLNCSKRDAFTQHLTKSPNLSLQYIAKAKKYDVHFYALDLEMDHLSKDIDGIVEIHGKTLESLDSVIFELHSGFNIPEIKLYNNTVSFNRHNSVVAVPVNLNQGEDFILEISYDGTAPDASSTPFGGSGLSNQTSSTYGNQVTWSLSEPFSAYEWWPCKQDLRDKADSVSVKITVPDICMAGSNGLLENSVDLGNGTTRYEWFHRHPIAYYLISVAIADYEEYNVYANPVGASQPVLIQNFVYDSPNYQNYENDINVTVDFIELFANLFGPYPFDDEKYGHCMAPIGGGMEHQTMTTQIGFYSNSLTAHELGHQWWGNNVTCASWSDIWVNEGFATYCSHLMYENLYPGQTASNMINIHNNVMSAPGGSIWVSDSLNPASIFSGRLSYDKGAAFVHTLRFMFNDDSLFFQTLSEFQDDFKDSVAIGLDVRDQLNAATNVNFDAAFEQWYFGEGFPTYNAVFNNIGNDLALNISHTTSSSTPTFTTPLEVRLDRTGMPDTTIRLDISSNDDHFTLSNIGGNVINVVIDPNNWIVNRLGTIQEDENYVSLNNESEIINLNLYPNPSGGIFKLSMKNSDLNSVKVYSTQGKLLIEEQFNSSTVIDLSAYENGYYIFKVMDQFGNQRIKTGVKVD